MSEKLPEIYMIRHGETAWTLSGQHTSVTDLELTDNGRVQAKLTKKRLSEKNFDKVFLQPHEAGQRNLRHYGLLGSSHH